MLASLLVNVAWQYEQAKLGGIHQEYSAGERRKRGLEWERCRPDWEKELRSAYEEITGELAPVASMATVEAAGVAVAKFAKQATSKQSLPVAESIDWGALACDLEAARALIAAYEAAIDEEEALTALVLAI